MTTSSQAEIGILGGSGFYQIDGLTDVSEVFPETPFGLPSDSIVLGTLEGRRLAFLPRHGRGHRFSPSEVPAQANILALKQLGVQRIISVSAVGSLKKELRPLDIVVPSQLYDNTKKRQSTFFGEGIVVHVGTADPFCQDLSAVLFQAAENLGARAHNGGAYICIEGPQFSTRAESRVYQQWGMDIIGMTAVPEAKLAREAEMCYATLALVTDYDTWHEEDVSVEMVVENLSRNVQTAKAIVKEAVRIMTSAPQCACSTSLKDAIITQRDVIPEQTKQKLGILVSKYL